MVFFFFFFFLFNVWVPGYYRIFFPPWNSRRVCGLDNITGASIDSVESRKKYKNGWNNNSRLNILFNAHSRKKMFKPKSKLNILQCGIITWILPNTISLVSFMNYTTTKWDVFEMGFCSHTPKWLRQSSSCWITCTGSRHNHHICLILHDLAGRTQNINFRCARFCLEMKRWTYRTQHKAPEGERPLGGYICNMCYPCQETLLFSRLLDRSELEISCKNSSENTYIEWMFTFSLLGALRIDRRRSSASHWERNRKDAQYICDAVGLFV